MKQRVESVDMLRGLTIVAMILVNNPGTWGAVYSPLLHAEWHGLTPTDLIFPFFLFIVGISISYAYKNKKAEWPTYKKIIIRSLKLIGLGLFLGWFLPYFPFFKSFETLRFPGVLQRIGIVFFISALLFLHSNWKQLIIIGSTILVTYFIFMGFAVFPDGTAPTFDRAANNWANYIDLNVLGKHMWKADYDPEGLMSTLPAIATCISGILIGKVLATGSKVVMRLCIIGAALLTVGYVWSMWFPLNKAIWSSSFVLVTSGYATVILALVYYFTDVRKIKMGSIFKYVGMNAITIFFLSGFIAKTFALTKIGENDNIHTWLFSLYTNVISDLKLASFLYALTVALFFIGLGYAMFKKKIFIKV